MPVPGGTLPPMGTESPPEKEADHKGNVLSRSPAGRGEPGAFWTFPAGATAGPEEQHAVAESLEAARFCVPGWDLCRIYPCIHARYLLYQKNNGTRSTEN